MMMFERSLHHKATIIMFVALFLTAFTTNVYADYQTDLALAGHIQDGSGDLSVESYPVPFLYDWNSDGKIDLLVGEKSSSNRGYVRFYENNSTNATPVFNGYTDTGVDVTGN
jgi:hypothetical protein